jgi:hypothetical protein
VAGDDVALSGTGAADLNVMAARIVDARAVGIAYVPVMSVPMRFPWMMNPSPPLI